MELPLCCSTKLGSTARDTSGESFHMRADTGATTLYTVVPLSPVLTYARSATFPAYAFLSSMMTDTSSFTSNALTVDTAVLADLRAAAFLARLRPPLVLAELAFLRWSGRMILKRSMLADLRASAFLAPHAHVFNTHLSINPLYVKMASLRVRIDP